jgi:hypothetical protein
VNAGVPLQRELWVHIAEASDRAINAVGARERKCATRCRHRSRESSIERCTVRAIGCKKAGRGLTAEHRRFEGLVCDQEADIQISMDVGIRGCGDIRLTDRDLAGARHVAAGGD